MVAEINCQRIAAARPVGPKQVGTAGSTGPGLDLDQQSSCAVADPGNLAGHFVVVADDEFQVGLDARDKLSGPRSRW